MNLGIKGIRMVAEILKIDVRVLCGVLLVGDNGTFKLLYQCGKGMLIPRIAFCCGDPAQTRRAYRDSFPTACVHLLSFHPHSLSRGVIGDSDSIA